MSARRARGKAPPKSKATVRDDSDSSDVLEVSDDGTNGADSSVVSVSINNDVDEEEEKPKVRKRGQKNGSSRGSKTTGDSEEDGEGLSDNDFQSTPASSSTGNGRARSRSSSRKKPEPKAEAKGKKPTSQSRAKPKTQPKPVASSKASKAKTPPAKASKAKTPVKKPPPKPRKAPLNSLLKNAGKGRVEFNDVIYVQPPGPAFTKFVPKPGPAARKAEMIRKWIEEDVARRKKTVEVVDVPDSSDEEEVTLAALFEYDSDCDLAAELPKKCRVGLKIMSREDVHYYQNKDKPKVAETTSRSKVKYLGGQKVNLIETPRKRARSPSPVIPRESYLPQRAARGKKVRYNDDYVSDFDDDDLEEDGRQYRREVRRRERKKAKRTYENDSDFSDKDDTAEDSDGSYDSEISREEERQRKRLRAEEQAALVNDLKLLNNINQSKRVNRSAVKAPGIERTFNVTGKSQTAKYWMLFVRYLVTNEETKGVNPFQPEEEHINDFIELMHHGGRHDTTGLARIMKFLVKELEWSEERKGSFLDDATLPTSKLEDRKAKNEIWKRLARIGVIFNNKGLENFIVFCHGLVPPVDPYKCGFEVIEKFNKIFVIKGNVVLTKHNIANFLSTFSQFHVTHYGEEGKPLTDRPEFDTVKRISDTIEAERLTFPGATEGQEKQIAENIPDYKLEKYVMNHPAEDFFREKVVFTLLEEIFQEDEMVAKLDIREGANKLGVSVNMVFANFCKTVFPKNLLPMVRAAYEDSDQEAFWFEHRVESVLEKVRDQDISIAQGALEVGAAYREFKGKVGELREKKVVVKEKKEEKNAMEKQIDVASKTEDMSEYERMRLKNIEERLALFKSLNFGEFKAPKKEKAETKEKEAVQSREKSRRIKTKESQVALGASGDSRANIETKVPAIDELLIEDLASVGIDLPSRKKMLSCLNREITLRDANEENAEGNGKMENDGDFGHYSTKRQLYLTTERISSMSVFPHPELTLLAAGDRTGAVNLWFSRDLDDEAQSRQFTFNPHSSQINHVVFNPFSPEKLLSCGKDGFIRSSDLLSGKVSLVYNWQHFSDDYYSKAVSHIAPRSANELVLSRWDEQILLFDSRSKRDAKVLAEHVRMAERSDRLTSGSVSFSPKNEHVFAVPLAGSIGFFDVRKEREPVAELEIAKPMCALFSPSGESLFVVGEDKRTGQVFKVDEDDFSTEIVSTLEDYLPPLVWGEESKTNAVWMPWTEEGDDELLFAAARVKTANLIDKKSFSIGLAVLGAMDGEVHSSVDEALGNNEAVGLTADRMAKSLVVFNSHNYGSVTLVKSSSG